MSESGVLAKAWLGLIVLSALSALLTTGLVPVPAKLAGSALLVFALLKARYILLVYLGLRHAPSWRRGFMMVIAGFVAALAALYLAA